jgi:hypothetical protein
VGFANLEAIRSFAVHFQLLRNNAPRWPKEIVPWSATKAGDAVAQELGDRRPESGPRSRRWSICPTTSRERFTSRGEHLSDNKS